MAACALLGAVCSANASQTPEAGKTYYLYNPTTGLFLSRGAGYGTAVWADNFGIPVTLVSSESGYLLQYLDQQDQYVSDAYWSWADGGTDRAQAYTLSEVSGGYKLINTAHGDNNLTLYIAEGANNEGFSHQIASNGKYGDNCNENWDVWQFLSSEEREAILANRKATKEAEIATSLGYTLGTKTLKEYVEDANSFASTNKSSSLTNASLTHNSDGWAYAKKGNGGGPAGKDGNGVEVFQGCGTFSQSVTGLTNGLYKVTVSAFYRDGSNELCSTNSKNGWKVSNAYLEANGNQTMIADWASDRSSDTAPNDPAAAKSLFDNGKYLNEVFVLVEDGNLTISIAQPGGATTSRWFLFTNVTLTYYSDQVSEEDATAILESFNTLTSKPMLKDVLNQMTNAKNTFESSKTIANYNALSSAIEAANLSIAAYAPLGDKLTEAASVKTAVSSNLPSYVNTFDTKIATITTNYNEGNIAEADIATQIGNVETEIRNLVKSQTEEGSDMSRAIPNAAGNAAVNNDNWKIENALAEGENFRLDTWAGSASGMSVPMIEYWIANGNTLSGNTIYQTISGLAAGTYTVTATIAVNNESTVAPNAGSALLFANDKTKDITTGGTVTSFSGNTGTFSVSVTLSEGQDLKIGLKTVEPNYNWIAFKDFKLIKGEIKPKSISLDKTSANLMAGETTTIIATVDEDASNKTVIWTSSDEKVATVANGVISAVGAGSATITAKCEADENVSTTASVSVTNAAAPKNWTVLPDGFDQGDFFIRNVGTGKFLGGANSWGTQASIIEHGIPFGFVKVSDGVYTLDSYTYNNSTDHFLGTDKDGNLFIDQGSKNITVTSLGNGKYALSTAENSYVTAKAGTTVVDNSATSSNASLAQWQFLSADDMLKNLKDGDTDATFFLSEANISRNLRKSSGASAWVGGFTYGGNHDNQCAESINKTHDVYQTVSVPNGTYTVKVQGFYRPGESAIASKFYANTEEVDLKKYNDETLPAESMAGASTAFTAGRFWNTIEDVTVTDNKLTIGVKTEATDSWTIWDNFELELTTTSGLNVTESSKDAYLTADNGQTYICRGAVSGTQGIVSATNELYATITTNIAGISTITFKDKLDKNGLWGERLFLSNSDGDDGNVYTDGKRHVEKNYHHHYWAVESSGSGYKLRNIEYGKYLGVGEGNVLAMVSADDAAVWTFDTQSSAADLYSNATSAEGSYNPGFENGEHAPYNNVAKLSAIAHVKELGSEGQYPSLKIKPLSDAISSAWVANSGEVNAFYKGDFSGYDEDNKTPLDYTPYGWTASNNFRMMLTNTETYPGLADASAKQAVMSWSGGITYGEQTGYEMPLKPNSVYTLKLKAAGWNNESRSGISVSILNGEDGMALYDLGTSDRDIKGNDNNTAGMTSYEIVFATGAAGNYVFHVQSGHNMVLTDFDLRKAASQDLVFADGAEMPKYAPGTYPSVKISRTMEADRWYTAVYPFVVKKSDVGTIAVLNSYNNGVLGFTTENVTASEANEPFLMRSNSKKTEIELSNVEVAAAAATDVTVGDVLSLKGVYAETTVNAGENVTNYVLSNNTIYKVGANAATVNPYHAYIQLALPTLESRELTFTVDGEATGISEVKAQNNAADGNIYNLNGQRVKNAKKGVYIMNGKTVIVK